MRRIFIILGLTTSAVFGLLFYQYTSQQKEAVQLQNYQAVMQEKMGQVYEEAQDWSTPIQLNLSDARLQGDYQIMADFVLRQMVQNIEARNAYLRELKAIGWPNFLDIERLDRDRMQQYRETEQMLQQARVLAQHYQQQRQQREQTALQQAKDLPIKARFRQQLADSLRESQKSDQTHALFAIELQVLDKAEAMFLILKNHAWVKKNKTFMFHDDKTVKQFNALYREVLQLNAQMEHIKKQSAKAVEQKL